MNDNRRYDYTNWGFGARAEFQVIVDWMPDGAKVIDLACGNGSLMKLLKEKRGVDYTDQEIRELASVKLERFLDPRAIRSDLLSAYRRQRPPVPLPSLPGPPRTTHSRT